MTPSSVGSKPAIPYPDVPVGASQVPPDLAEWFRGILDGSVSTQPIIYSVSYTPGGWAYTPKGTYTFAPPPNVVPATAIPVYRAVAGLLFFSDPPNPGRVMKDRLAAYMPVETRQVLRPELGPFAFETVCYVDRAALARLVSDPAKANANALWDKAWNQGGFDANYQAWLNGAANDPLRSASGFKVALSVQVAEVLRSKTNQVLRINSAMNDMNAVLKKLNGMTADAKSRGDTDQITYATGIAMGSNYAGGNAWAAQVKPLWDSWGVDTSKFSVTADGRLVIEKRYIEVVVESLKIALDKASSEAQQEQLDLNNILTQFNGGMEAASAIYQSKKSLDMAVQPRG